MADKVREKAKQVRAQFEAAMIEAGWEAKRDIWKHVHSWRYPATDYVIQDRHAYQYYLGAEETPVPF